MNWIVCGSCGGHGFVNTLVMDYLTSGQTSSVECRECAACRGSGGRLEFHEDIQPLAETLHEPTTGGM